MASDNCLLPELAHVAGEVVDEGVVVVDEQDHDLRAAIKPRALSSVSRYSCSGSESATVPGWHTRDKSLRSRSTIITFSALSLSLSASARASAASCSGPTLRGRVPLMGRVSTRRPASTHRKRSGDELTTTTSPNARYAANGAGLRCRRRRYNSNGVPASGASSRCDRFA